MQGLIDHTLVRKLLQFDEGLRLYPYDDATGKTVRTGSTIIGKQTIGIGRNLDPSGPGLSAVECGLLEDDDIAMAAGAVKSVLPAFDTLDPVRQSVLVDMAFNLGRAGLMGFHTMLGCIQAGDFDGAADAMGDSHWAIQVKSRATRLIEMMRSGTAPPLQS